MGMLAVTKKRALDYYLEDTNNRCILPLGLEHPVVIGAIIKVARSIPLEKQPSEIWTVGSSGTLSRGLQMAFPNVPVNVVQVGHKMNAREIGRAKLYVSPYKFDKPVKPEDAPPFPSVATYDAKAWSFIKEYGRTGGLFYNVA